MAKSTPHLVKRTLDKDLDKIAYVEEATNYVSRGLVGPGIGLVFLVVAMIFAGVYVINQPGAAIVIAAAAIAQNPGPASGRKRMVAGTAHRTIAPPAALTPQTSTCLRRSRPLTRTAASGWVESS